MSSAKLTELDCKVSEIKARRKFVKQYMQNLGDKVVDIWATDDNEMYFAYGLTENHIMWRMTFSFMTTYVSVCTELCP